MADLGTIGIAIEVRGREALRQIEADMGVVDKTAKSAARSFEAFERAGLKTADTFRYMSDASKKRLAEEQKITQELIKQRSAAEQLARANAQKFQSQIGSNLGLGARGISAGASAGAFEAEIERLRQKYDKIYASSQLYERSLTELNKAHALGVLSTKQHESALESLNAEYQNFQNGTAGIGNRFAQNIQQNMAGVSNAGVLMQQLGYQAGDFIVQVQSGTNAFVAFGQQATQMVGFLPMMAQSMNIATVSVLGFNVAIAPLTLGLSIVIPLLTAAGAAWMRTSSDSDGAAKSIDRQAQAYNTLIDRVRELRLERQMEATGVASQEEQIVLNDLNKLLENRVILQDRLNQLQNAGGRAAGYAQAKQEQMDLLQADIDRNEAAIKAIQYERDLATAASRRANEQRNAYREAKAEADRWKASLEGIKSVLDSMNGMAVSVTLDLQSTASGWASEFLGKLTTGLENKAEYVKAVGGGRGLGMGGPELDPYGFRKQLDRVPAGKSGSSGSKRSGGGGGSLAENRMEEIYRYLESDKYLIEQENLVYQQRQETLESSLKNKIITLEEYNQIEKDLKTKHEYELASIEQNARSQRLDDAAGFFGSLASVAEAGGGKMVKAASIFSAAQGLINSYTAYTEMLKDPAFIGRPWARFGAAASVLASGLRMVQAIKGAGSGGSGAVGGGGSVGSATVASSASAPAPQTVFIDSLDPDGLYSGQALINLFDAFYDENDRRGKVFVVGR